MYILMIKVLLQRLYKNVISPKPINAVNGGICYFCRALAITIIIV